MSEDQGPSLEKLRRAVAGEDQDLLYINALMPVIGDFVRLAQLATNGDVTDVPRLVQNPKDFYQNLVSETRSALMGYMMVRSLNEFMTKESKKDPLEHGKFLLEIVKYHDAIRELEPHAKRVEETASVTDQLLRDVERARDPVQKPE